MCWLHAARYIGTPSKLPLGRLADLVPVPSTPAFKSQDFFPSAASMPRGLLRKTKIQAACFQRTSNQQSAVLNRDLNPGCQVQNRTASTLSILLLSPEHLREATMEKSSFWPRAEACSQLHLLMKFLFWRSHEGGTSMNWTNQQRNISSQV